MGGSIHQSTLWQSNIAVENHHVLIDKSSGNEPFSIATEVINQPITGGHQSCWNNIFHGQGTRVNIGNGHLIIELELPIVAITFPY